ITRIKSFGIFALMLAVACYWFILVQKNTLSTSYDYGFLRAAAGFALGIWAYQLTQMTRISSIKAGVLSVIAIALAVWIALGLHFANGVTEAAVLPAFLLAILFLHQDIGVGARFLSSRVMKFLGRISYSIYMIHFPIITCILLGLKLVIPRAARL